jgi:hypothetical protein
MEGWIFYFVTRNKAMPITFLQRDKQPGGADYDEFVFEIVDVEQDKKEKKMVQMTRTLLGPKEKTKWDSTTVLVMAGRCLIKWFKDNRNPLSLGTDNYRNYQYTKFVEWDLIEREILGMFYHFNRVLVADNSLSFLDLMISTEFSDVQLLTTMEYLTKRGFLIQDGYYTDFRVQRYKLNQLKVDDIEKRLETPKPLKMGENKYYREVDIKPEGDFVFVIMPFSEDEMEQNVYTEGIKPTVENTLRIQCLRSDEDLTPRKIDDKIYTLIKKSKIVIAEITTGNPNVFLELGIAQILNKDIILLNNKTQGIEVLPFDIRVDTVRFYSDIVELKKVLKEALEAI